MKPIRRKPKSKVPTTIKVNYVVFHDPMGDERKAQVEISDWIETQVAGLPPLAVERKTLPTCVAHVR